MGARERESKVQDVKWPDSVFVCVEAREQPNYLP